MGAIRGAMEALRGLSGVQNALERIADALERLSPPVVDDGRGDGSGVTYVDDHAAALLEVKQEEYYRRTGRRLRDGEPPPAPEYA